MTRASKRDVTIVGAGPVGIVLSILLAQRGYEVDVYEGHPDPRVNPRSGGRSINLTMADRGWLAEKHFDELARSARDPLFLVRRAIEERLHAMAPDRFVPLYTMVAFGSRPYREIAAARARQEALLDRMMSVPDIGDRLDDEEIWGLARSELDALDTGAESLDSDLEAAVRPGALRPAVTVS